MSSTSATDTAHNTHGPPNDRSIQTDLTVSGEIANYAPSYVSVGSRLFALVIGINRYQVGTFGNLRGAEPDANEFILYLKESLLVPEKQITVLLNEQATRVAIIQAFSAIPANPFIHEGDPIVIFFAGHGAEQEVAGTNGKKIQMIVPHDFSPGPEKLVNPITDRELQRLVRNIALRKGDNITKTVILDCCHSASGTRDINSDLTRVRSIEINGLYNAGHDQHEFRDANLPEGRARVSVDAIQKHDLPSPTISALQSHMLISACSASEKARETSGRGNFSVAFIRLLKLYSPDKLDLLKYCDILNQMDGIDGQNPQCEGDNQSRPLFHSKIPVSHLRKFSVVFKAPDGSSSDQLIVKAGSADGVTPGAEFSIYKPDDTELLNPLAHTTVHSIEAFHSVLHDVPQPNSLDRDLNYIAIQTKLGEKEDLRLGISASDSHMKKIFEAVQAREPKGLYNIAVTANQRNNHLHASVVKNFVTFKMVDERVTRFGFKNTFPTVAADDSDRLHRVFGRIAHFYRELNLVNKPTKPSLSSIVNVNFYELDSEDDDPTPIGKNLYNDGIIDIRVSEEPDVPYGLELINNSAATDLYPYVFLFDNTDLSIVCHYKSPSLANDLFETDPPLKKKGTLSVGYGIDNGANPLAFVVKKGRDLDITFIKIVLSTQPIDVDHIAQSSPFEQTRSPTVWKPKKDRWDTILIPVVQRRNAT